MSRSLPPPEAYETALERTELSWSRSALAAVACIAILLRRAWPLTGDRELVVLAVIAGAATLWVTAFLLARRASSSGRQNYLLTSRAFTWITAATLVLAVVAFVLGLVSPA